MVKSSFQRGRYLLLGSVVCLLAGCAAGRGQNALYGATGCPPGFVLSCEARPGGVSNTLSKCRCASHAFINGTLRQQ